MQALETITNWLVIAGAIILLGVILASWLASYRAPKAAPVRSGDWFFVLPVWAQIVISALGTDPNRRLIEIIGGVSGLVVEWDEASLLRSQYRIVLLQKTRPPRA